MTKLFAGWPAILTTLSAGFTATICRTSNLFSGQPRSHIPRCPQIVVLCAVLFADCEEWFCFLVGSLPGDRHAIVCILFSLEQSRSLMDRLLRSLCICRENPMLPVLNSLSSCSDVMCFSTAILSYNIILCSRHPMSYNDFLCDSLAYHRDGIRAVPDVPFEASVSPCSTSFVFQKVGDWLHDCCSS